MAKSRGPSHKVYYASYKSQNKFAANRKRKLLRLAKQQPNNLQITEALKNITYRRKTPNTSHLTGAKKATISMMASIKNNKSPTFDRPVVKNMFTLGTRAHNKGELIWSSI